MDFIEMVKQTGINPKWAASTAGGEYHASCPACGGNDRFFIQPHRQMKNCLGSYCCRQCGIKGDAIQFARQFLNCSFQEAIAIVGATVLDKVFSPHRTTPYSAALEAPPEKWITEATNFVDNAHKELLLKEPAITSLAQRGISYSTILRFKLGWHSTDLRIPRDSWGLPDALTNGKQHNLLFIPQGITIPVIDANGYVIRLKIRRSRWSTEDPLPKYMAISGSMNGLSVIGSPKNHVVIVVESELDAFAISAAIEERACVIAVGSNIKNPDNVTNMIAQKAKQLIICHDNDEAGEKMLKKWKSIYAHATAYPTPIGKDIGEAIQQGLNPKEWLLKIIPDQ